MTVLVRARRGDARHLRRARRLRPRRRHPAPLRRARRRRAPLRAALDRSASGTATRSGSSPWAARSSSPSRALLATSFSGFYLPLMMVLWLLLFRRSGHRAPPPDRSPALDAVLGRRLLRRRACCSRSSSAPRSGNVVRGVSIDASGRFFAPLWTDFRVGRDDGHPRLVHGARRRDRHRGGGNARRPLAGLADHRGDARARRADRRGLVARRPGPRADHDGNHSLGAAARAARTSRPTRGASSSRSPPSRAWSRSAARAARRMAAGLSRFVRLPRRHARQRRVRRLPDAPAGTRPRAQPDHRERRRRALRAAPSRCTGGFRA